jgi:small-conductance mechanosensitive channel
MSDLWRSLEELWQDSAGQTGIKVAAILAIALIGYKLLVRMPALRRLHPQHQLIVRRLLMIAAFAFAIIGALNTLGVGIGVLLGTAGVLTVVIGFAAQTSASNLISGLFLMAEQPFRVGDALKIGDISGVVVSIELLSVRMRTFDNLLVRIANEEVIKSPLINLTHFPIRRIDLPIGVGYGSDLAEVTGALREAAAASPLCLVEPAPLIMVLGFGDSAVNLQLSVWTTTANFLEARNAVIAAVLAGFRDRGIEIPFPQRTLTVGAGQPLAIQIEERR